MTHSNPESPTNASPPVAAEGAAHGSDALRASASALLRAARREVRLAAPYLDPAIFNTGAVVDALAAFVTQHPRNRARVLIEDVNQVLRDNGRLIVLARRLPDAIELREVEENERGARDLYLLADRSLSLVQETMDRTDGVVSRAPHEIAALIERFDAAWERASPVALRTLGL